MICFYLTHFALLFNPFQSSVLFHIEIVKLQIKPDFYVECYTGLKWVKREYLSLLILNLVSQNVSKEVLLTGPKTQKFAKIQKLKTQKFQDSKIGRRVSCTPSI